MGRIVVVGSFNMDLVVRMPAIPRPGETLLGGVFATYPGGKGSNQAVAAARCGGEVTMIGRVGADAFGEQLLAMARSEGIDTRFVGVDEHSATGVALIEVDDQGQNSIAVASGANFTLTAAEVAAAFDQIGPFDLVVMPLETPMDTITTAAGLARKVGARVVLNPAPAQHLAPELVKNVDVLIPNEHEAAFMAGIEIHSPDDAREAAVRLLGCGAGSVIVTLGGEGALVAERDIVAEGDIIAHGPRGADGTRSADGAGRETAQAEAGHGRPVFTSVPAFQVRPVDTTAAGDGFVGALAVALGEGRSLPDAARFASAAAAISVTRTGAQPSLPTRGEVEEFLRARSA